MPRNCFFIWTGRNSTGLELTSCCGAFKREGNRVSGSAGVTETLTAMVREVLKEIGRRDRFVLTSHARPDGDAIGSALACCEILRQMGKQAEVVLNGPVPHIYQPLPFAD